MSYKRTLCCDLCTNEIDEMHDLYMNLDNYDYEISYYFANLKNKEHVCESCKNKINDFIKTLDIKNNK